MRVIHAIRRYFLSNLYYILGRYACLTFIAGLHCFFIIIIILLHYDVNISIFKYPISALPSGIGQLLLYSFSFRISHFETNTSVEQCVRLNLTIQTVVQISKLNSVVT